jgi:hypothetical protein
MKTNEASVHRVALRRPLRCPSRNSKAYLRVNVAAGWLYSRTPLRSGDMSFSAFWIFLADSRCGACHVIATPSHTSVAAG